MCCSHAKLALPAGGVPKRQPPRRVVRFLTIDRDVADASAVTLDELLRLHKHAAGAAARIIDAACIGFEHPDHRVVDLTNERAPAQIARIKQG